MPRHARDYDWIDDAFDDAKRDPLERDSDRRPVTAAYDWIDDAFDDAKRDPLEGKAMTGLSRVAILAGVVIAVILVVFLALGALDMASLLASPQ